MCWSGMVGVLANMLVWLRYRLLLWYEFQDRESGGIWW
jgi:hypothetical protein